MSDEFMIHVGMGSHARLVSEWAHYKSWAETSADEVESLRRQLAALRRGLQQLVGAPDVPPPSDAELFTLLGEVLDRAIDDRHVDSDPVGAEQPRGYVEYGKQPDGPPSLIVGLPYNLPDVQPVEPRKRVVPMGEPFVGGITVADATAGAEKLAAAVSPWLAPPPAAPRCGESVGRDRVCDAEVVDGHCPEHGEVGPPTESMPPVEEPPAVPDGYVLGRVFTRGDACLGREELDMVVNRLGEVMRVFTEGMNEGNGVVLHPDGREFEWADQLHMNGTLWEIVPSTGQAGEQVSGE